MSVTNNKYTVVRYGMCLNDSCSKSKTKELQQINGRKDFVCAECGKPLRECPPPKSWWNKNGKVMIGLLGTVVVLGVGSFFVMDSQSGDDSLLPSVGESEAVVENAVEETPIVNEQPVEKQSAKELVKNKEGEPVKKASSDNSLDLGYAVYKGRIKNSLPHDENGRMTFKEKHLIDKRDSQKRMAEPGDYIIGEYVSGKLVQGVWYNEKNTVKGSIIIGL